MSRLAVYRPDGSINRIIDVPDFLDEAQAETLASGEQIIAVPEWVEMRNAYVGNEAVVERQAMALTPPAPIAANGQDEAVITGIPAGVSVTWPDGQTDEVTDGEVRFSVDLPGTYRLRFTAVEYLDKEVIIEAVAAA